MLTVGRGTLGRSIELLSAAEKSSCEMKKLKDISCQPKTGYWIHCDKSAYGDRRTAAKWNQLCNLGMRLSSRSFQARLVGQFEKAWCHVLKGRARARRPVSQPPVYCSCSTGRTRTRRRVPLPRVCCCDRKTLSPYFRRGAKSATVTHVYILDA